MKMSCPMMLCITQIQIEQFYVYLVMINFQNKPLKRNRFIMEKHARLHRTIRHLVTCNVAFILESRYSRKHEGGEKNRKFYEQKGIRYAVT